MLEQREFWTFQQCTLSKIKLSYLHDCCLKEDQAENTNAFHENLESWILEF